MLYIDAGDPSTMHGSFVSSVPPMRSRSSTLDSLPAPPTAQPEYRPMTHISEQREPSNLGFPDPIEETKQGGLETRRVSIVSKNM